MVEVRYTAEYNVFVVDKQHFEQPECIINTYVLEKADSNVTPDSPDMCDNEIQTDHNTVKCDDERVALANLIANLKLNIDENKTIQKMSLIVCKEKASNVFLKEREQYFKIQDLKAQLQDKNIAISELKKLIEKLKGKCMDTNFRKQSILGKPPLQPMVRQPTAYKSERSQLPRHRIASKVVMLNNLTKPVTPHSWPQVRKLSFAKPYNVNAPGPSRNSPKHVSFQSTKEYVGSSGHGQTTTYRKLRKRPTFE
ncbi:hypothetical protein Tco_0767948 [Tanacetum coccineum]